MKRLNWLTAIVVLISCQPVDVRAAMVGGQTTATNSPLTSPVPGVGVAIADVAQLTSATSVPYTDAQVNTALSALLTDQGFTAANNWIYSFNGLPGLLTNPVGLGNANFNITTYDLRLNGAQTGFGETMVFTLQNPPPDPNLTGLNGATVKQHWLQLVNESVRIAGGTFGYQIGGLPGWWGLDNGFVVLNAQNPAAAPFYDSNMGPNIFPPQFSDTPQYFSPLLTGTTYLHFVTVPTWDVSYNGNDYLLVGSSAVEWGFVIVPEPSTFTIVFSFVVLCMVVRCVQPPCIYPWAKPIL
jgi:hypothetical protein